MVRRSFAWLPLVSVSLALLTPAAVAAEHKAPKSGAPKLCAAFAEAPLPDTDLKAAYDIVMFANLRKDEFETTDAYKKRFAAEISSINERLIDLQGHSYIIGSESIPQSRLTYDADKRQLVSRYGLAFTSGHLGGRDWKVILADRIVTNTGMYVGTNAFGVSKPVSREDHEDYTIYFANTDGISSARAWPSESYRITQKMEPAEVREVVNSLRAVIVGSLIEPFEEDRVRTTSPKIDSPYEINTHAHILTVRAECSFIVSGGTRKVISRVN